MYLGEHVTMPVAVLAMVVCTLLMAAIVRQHQLHRARLGAIIRRYDVGAREIEDALGKLHEVPLSQELRVLFRGEVYARYRRIQRLFKRYPGIAQRIAQAESRLAAQGPMPAGGVGAIENDAYLQELLAALDGLSAFLAAGHLLQPAPADLRQSLRRELGERRAEVNARYHLVRSRHHERENDVTRARVHLTTLMQVLRSKGPSTEFVRSLYNETEMALKELTERQLKVAFGDTDEAGDTG